jgi:hypothetical protein
MRNYLDYLFDALCRSKSEDEKEEISNGIKKYKGFTTRHIEDEADRN